MLSITALILAGALMAPDDPPAPAKPAEAPPAQPAEAPPAPPAQAAGQPKEYRSKITDGSYSIGPDGQVHMEFAFEGEHPIIDMKAGAVLVVKSGMTLAELKKAAAASRIELVQLKENEFQAADKTLIFVDGKLTRIRE